MASPACSMLADLPDPLYAYYKLFIDTFSGMKKSRSTGPLY